MTSRHNTFPVVHILFSFTLMNKQGSKENRMLTSSHVVDLKRSICHWSYTEVSQIKRSVHVKNGK